MTGVIAALITALAVLGAALVAAFVGPAWKLRQDRKREIQDVFARYSLPLLQVAFELQSRLYNIARLAFLADAWRGDDDYRREYAEMSTVWLIGQYLGWIEILRREAQFLELGDVAQTRQLRERLLAVRDHLASDRYGDPALQIYRSDQRAIGERMIVRRETEIGGTRSDCLGYAEFRAALEVPSFASWFKRLRESIGHIAISEPPARLIFTQRALVDLVDLLDPNRSIFPDPDTRGMLSRPIGIDTSEDPRPWEKLGRFSDDAGWKPFERWAAGEQLKPGDDACRRLVRGKPGLASAVLVVEARRHGHSLELRGWAEPPTWVSKVNLAPNRLPLESGGWKFVLSRARARRSANRLLERYDRPAIL